jgi:phosphatidylglycerol:prolipoprotein diacylglycerol transferase
MIPFLHLGPLTIPTFGLMVALAMIAAYYVLRADLARRDIAKPDSGLAEYFITIPCLAGIIGARLYHALQSPADLAADPVGQLFSRYGFAWFGGLIAGFTGYVWVARWKRIPLLTALDAGSPAAALGYGIGRIGCLLSGDGDYGIPTSLPWGMSFPNGLVPTTDRVHPTPIYEFLAACAIACILWRLGAHAAQNSPGKGETQMTSGKVETQMTFPGSVFAAYLVLTGAARFSVEFIRINPHVILGMSNAQAASALSMLAGVALWLWIRKRPAAAAAGDARYKEQK